MTTNTVYKIFPEKLGNANASTFVGDKGEIFYDPTVGLLKLSDGVTPGGIPITGGPNNEFVTTNYTSTSTLQSDYYTKTEIDQMQSTQDANLFTTNTNLATNYYTKTQIDQLQATQDNNLLTNYYTKAQVDALIPVIPVKGPGDVLQTLAYSFNGGGIVVAGFFGMPSTGLVMFVNVTPKSSNSKFFVSIDGNVILHGTDEDGYTSVLKENSTNTIMGKHIAAQQRLGGNEEGWRTQSLLPISGVYRNTSTATKTFMLTLAMEDGDDNFTLSNEGGSFFIQEIQQ